MPVGGDGKSSFYLSLSYLSAWVEGKDRDTAKGMKNCALYLMWVRGHTHTWFHTLSVYTPVNRGELHVNVPPFSFNRPLETVQRAFCWLTGEIRSEAGGELRGGVGRGLQRLAQLAFYFFYRKEAPLSIGPHLPCSVIVEHNGAHLIQGAQSPFFIYSEAIFLIWSQTFREILQSFVLKATTNFPLKEMLCVIKITIWSVLIIRHADIKLAIWPVLEPLPRILSFFIKSYTLKTLKKDAFMQP